MNKRPEAGHDIMIHVTALETLAAQLNDLGEPISDNTLMTTILCKIPPRFKWFTHAWQNLRDNERTLEAFRARLISEQRSLDLGLRRCYSTFKYSSDSSYRSPSSYCSYC
jgi:hypothetical protein